jgi:hypothetical protein
MFRHTRMVKVEPFHGCSLRVPSFATSRRTPFQEGNQMGTRQAWANKTTFPVLCSQTDLLIINCKPRMWPGTCPTKQNCRNYLERKGRFTFAEGKQIDWFWLVDRSACWFGTCANRKRMDHMLRV